MIVPISPELSMRVAEVGKLDIRIYSALGSVQLAGIQVARERGARSLESHPLCCFPNRSGVQRAGVFVPPGPLDRLVWIRVPR